MSADLQRLQFVVACWNAATQGYSEKRMGLLAIAAMNRPGEPEAFWRTASRAQRAWRSAVTNDPRSAPALLDELEGLLATVEVTP